MAEYLSENFSLEELTYSDTARVRGIDNTPTEIHKKTLKHTCWYLLDPLRALLNEKYKVYSGKKVKKVCIRITSGYRCPKLNAAVGGAPTSGHTKGECVDIEAILVYTNNTKSTLPFNILYEDIKNWVKLGRISVDQCIQEKSGTATWVHVSHSASGRTKDRRQFLKYNGKNYTVDVDLL